MFRHYATLECGHQVSFDMDRDLIATAAEQNADARVGMPCEQCGGVARLSIEIRVEATDDDHRN